MPIQFFDSLGAAGDQLRRWREEIRLSGDIGDGHSEAEVSIAGQVRACNAGRRKCERGNEEDGYSKTHIE